LEENSLGSASQHSPIRHYPLQFTASLAAGRAINALKIAGD
jgi:hypothetical protein